LPSKLSQDEFAELKK